jgi:hypothetical protein
MPFAGLKAMEMHIRLLVDMEWTYINPACSALASAMMKVFNKEFPLACSTVQCYLKVSVQNCFNCLITDFPQRVPWKLFNGKIKLLANLVCAMVPS